MALTVHEARALRKNDVVYTSYTRPNGQPGVTTWHVIHNQVVNKPGMTRVVNVTLVTGSNASGKLTNANLGNFYLTYGEATKGDK